MGWGYLFALLGGLPFTEFIRMLPLALLWLFSAAAFGYLLNDVCDIRSDEKAGKHNAAARLPKGTVWVLLLLLALLAQGAYTGLVWEKSRIWLLLPPLHFLMFALYSFPATRFKEIPILDLLSDALYAQVLPLLALYVALVDEPFSAGLRLFFAASMAWALVSGLHNILEHQLVDEAFDRKAGVRNFVQRYGSGFALRFCRKVCIPAEFFCFLITVAVLCSLSTEVGISLFVVGGLAFLFSPFGENILPQIQVYRGTEKKWPLRFIYEAGIPLLALLALGLDDWRFWFLLPVHVVLFGSEMVKLAKDFVLRFLWYGLVHGLLLGVVWYGFLLKIWIAFKIAVNYGIYYFRIYALGYSKEKARGKYSD